MPLLPAALNAVVVVIAEPELKKKVAYSSTSSVAAHSGADLFPSLILKAYSENLK